VPYGPRAANSIHFAPVAKPSESHASAGLTDTRPRPFQNYLLARLPDDEVRRLRPQLRPVPMAGGHVFQRQGDALEHVYFPEGGVTSLTGVMEDGRVVELATVGLEGLVGLSAAFGHAMAMTDAAVQVPDGVAHAMPIGVFRDEMERRAAFWRVINRYSQTFFSVLLQSIACNSLHSVEERCCRWLLAAHDRLGETGFPITQEFLAVVLGVRRPTVTVVAGTLQRRGLIECARRRITILDRAGLEGASCECYRFIRTQFSRLREDS
jgi:CRP-like cAMP-binding protein